MPAPAVAMGGEEPVVVLDAPGEPGTPALPVPTGELEVRVVAVPLDQTGVAMAGVAVVVQEVDVVVVMGLVIVQGQSVIVKVVA